MQQQAMDRLGGGGRRLARHAPTTTTVPTHHHTAPQGHVSSSNPHPAPLSAHFTHGQVVAARILSIDQDAGDDDAQRRR
jgi:hypothetical protein